MKTTIKYCLVILMLVFASCNNRDWDNPFDPDCPKELFTPANFTAKQEGNLVKLTWTQPNTHISGFVIERNIDGGTWTAVATPSKTELTWSDSNITGGKEHKYRLVAKAGSNRSNEVTAQITPVFAAALTTKALTKLLSTSAILGGEITSDGGSPVTARGVCWSTSSNPTISNSKTTDGTGIGNFTSTLVGLNTSTIYYVRAYATTSVGTSYGSEITFKTFFGEVTDVEGNVYPTVKIGTQIWMAENLKTTKYNDGTAIPNVTDNTAWAALTTGAYCYYNNEASNNKATYGALYNWYAVNTNKLAPTGWHVPSDNEWKQLEMALGMIQAQADATGWRGTDQGTQIKTNSGWNINGNGTNTSGFSGLPGGCRQDNGGFNFIGNDGNWWSSTENSSASAWGKALVYNHSGVYRSDYGKKNGFSVRCILGVLNLPSISTTAISNKTSTSATCGGNITSDGSAPVTARGVCWSTSQNPTTANSKTSDGTGIGSYTSNVTGLTTNTTYYVRAYAINSQGTAYGAQESFLTSSTSSQTVTDIEGNVYNTVTIGTQVWMAENLKTAKYNDGTAIQNVTGNTTWAALTTGAYCWYNNDLNNKNIYGAIYNWYAVNTGKLAPTGWHVATDAEWTTLANYLGGENVAGGKLKETGTNHWQNPNTGATNETGFSALPGGLRNYDGVYYHRSIYGYWWSFTEYTSSEAWNRYTDSGNTKLLRTPGKKTYGFNIRCILGTLNSLSVSTTTISNKTASSASSGGIISSDGGSTVTARGVCWSTSQNPTTANSKTTDGTGTVSFTSNITGLTANTTYYVRAYAINSQGTSYGAQESFTTSSTSAQTVTDIEGNVYKTVTIGTQVWMAENLKTTKFNDGTAIPLATSASYDLETPGYCWYNNDATTYKITYGALYNWYTVNTGKLCPTGWHVPTDSEWTILTTYLGGESLAGGKLKETGTSHWQSPNTGATNETGFNAVPGGMRSGGAGSGFTGIGINANWWTNTNDGPANAYARELYYSFTDIRINDSWIKHSQSVRCVRD